MTKCYLLGAGASYGYDEYLSSDERPPLSTEFFTKGIILNIFTETGKYSRLWGSLKDYLSNIGKNPNDISNFNVDIECFLNWLAKMNAANLSKLKDQVSMDESQFKLGYNIQCALGEIFYFVFELLRHYSLSYKARFDCYRRLALHYSESKYSVLTLNYDTLFEAAILSVYGYGYYYKPPRPYPKSIPIAKLHGSINWLNPYGGGIAYGGIEDDSFNRIVCAIYSNEVFVARMIFLQIPALREIGVKELIRSGTDYDEPALIPPLANYKDYEKVTAYKEIWEFGKYLLSDATELIVIGCSIRDEDAKLLDLLKSSTENMTVTIVDKNPQMIQSRLEKVLKKPKFSQQFNSFCEYAKTL
jgi:hypothetical protein